MTLHRLLPCYILSITILFSVIYPYDSFASKLDCTRLSGTDYALCNAVEGHINTTLEGQFKWDAQDYLFKQTLSVNKKVGGSRCSPLYLTRVLLDARLLEPGSVNVSGSLNEPTLMALELPINLNISGYLKQDIGFKFFGRCTKLSSETFSIGGHLETDALLGIVLHLNPSKQQFNTQTDITIKPELFATVEFKHAEVHLDALGINELSSAWHTLSSTNSLATEGLEKIVNTASYDWGDTLSYAGTVGGFNRVIGVSAISMPGVDWQSLTSTLEQWEVKLSANNAVLRLQDSLRQTLVNQLKLNEYREKLYQIKEEHYERVNQLGESGLMFAAGSIDYLKTAFDFICGTGSGLLTSMRAGTQPSDYVAYTGGDLCLSILINGTRSIGDASLWNEGGTLSTTPWQHNPTTQLNIGVLSIKENFKPYMKRATYKRVQTQRGMCELEMRVYKKNPGSAEISKPILAIHGGGWRYRGALSMLESQVSHFTELGHTVFVPVYRLSGQAEGPYACNNSDGLAVLDDIEDVLTWIESHGYLFGATGKPILFGQSSGAHLAVYLATYFPHKVDRAWIMYSPTDLQHYLETTNFAANNEGTSAITGFLSGILPAGGLAKLDVSHPFVRANSFPRVISQSGDVHRYPPVLMMHGVKDEIVPTTQSIRLCNALSGENNLDIKEPVVELDNFQRLKCGEHGELFLFERGEHALDFCIPGLRCPAGDRESAQSVADSFQFGLQWIQKSFDRSSSSIAMLQGLEQGAIDGEVDGYQDGYNNLQQQSTVTEPASPAYSESYRRSYLKYYDMAQQNM